MGWFKIDPKSFTPIFEQIKQQLKILILRGGLKPNDTLPSIRDLAAELVVNPNTVARAYRELEQEGIISTRRGKGCYVAEDCCSRLPEDKTRIISQVMDEAIRTAREFQMSPEDIRLLFQNRLKNKEGQTHGGVKSDG